MKVKLVVCEGPSRGVELSLQPGRPVKIGRGAQAEMRVTDTAVSREHCEVVPQGDYWVVRDLDSRNHVFVGKKVTQEHVLKDGDVFRLGRNTGIMFQVHDTTREVKSEPPPAQVEPVHATTVPVHDATMPIIAPELASFGPGVALDPGSPLGEFRVAERLGRVGSAFCYRALQPSLNRNVLLHVYPEKLSQDPAFRERLMGEVRTVSPLLHPHILQLFDVEEDGDRLFLIMEYFKGGPLADYLEKKSFLPIRSAIDLALQLCDAIEYASGQQWTMTVLETGNILFDEKPTSKLRVLRDPVTGASGTSPAELSCMAPELLSPTRPPDIRSAVYSLGALLFRCVGGMPPFSAPEPDALKAKILRDPPRDLKKLNIRASDGLCEIVRKALEKLPQNRHQTPGELAQDLKKLVGTTR